MGKFKAFETKIYINDDYYTIQTTRPLKDEEICNIYKCTEEEIMGIEVGYMGLDDNEYIYE